MHKTEVYSLPNRWRLHVYWYTVSWGCFVCVFLFFSSISMWFTFSMARVLEALHVSKWKTLYTFGFNKASSLLKIGSSHESSTFVFWKGWKGQFSVLLPMGWTIPSSLLENTSLRRKLSSWLAILVQNNTIFLHLLLFCYNFSSKNLPSPFIVMFLNDLAKEKCVWK